MNKTTAFLLSVFIVSIIRLIYNIQVLTAENTFRFSSIAFTWLAGFIELFLLGLVLIWLDYKIDEKKK